MGNQSLSSLQKITTLRLLTLGIAGDAIDESEDEYVWIGESTALEAFKNFSNIVFRVL